jgi:hypothetical protein
MKSKDLKSLSAASVGRKLLENLKSPEEPEEAPMKDPLSLFKSMLGL